MWTCHIDNLDTVERNDKHKTKARMDRRIEETEIFTQDVNLHCWSEHLNIFLSLIIHETGCWYPKQGTSPQTICISYT